MNRIELLKYNKVLYNVSPPGDDFPTGGGGSGGGDGTTTSGGGTNGGQSGTTSSIVIPSLSISPSTDQSIATGTTICFTASGSISLPQEPEQNAVLNAGCAQSLGTGIWVKNCGTSPAPDAETVNSTLLYRNQPFHIVAQNAVFGTPGGSMNNSDALLGVKTTNGYYFYWDVLKYCNSTPGYCESNWLGYVRVINPNGVGSTLSGGLVEANQKFKVRSDGTRIIWEYTTENNWAYNYYSIPIPEDSGDFQFFVNALYVGNTWANIRTYRGSYQATVKPEDFLWNSNCLDNLVINGNKACYTPLVPGSCQVCVSTINTEPKCVNVVSSPLFLKPVNIPCQSCGDETDCSNIPNPTQPSISLSSTVDDAIDITWDDSTSFTTGLFYEVNINSAIQNVLDSTMHLTGLVPGVYDVSIRAIDACGQSDWTPIQSITIPVSSSFEAPQNFTIDIIDDSDPSNIIYGVSWDSVLGAVAYEVWAGNPQSTLLSSTILTNITLGTLFSGLSLSVRAIDAFSNYSPFSSIEVIV